MANKNYTPHHLLLFTGIDVKCTGASTWILHDKKEVLTPVFMKTLMEDDAINWVKPLLRPLESMTSDEALHIAKLCLDINDSDITDKTYIYSTPFKDGAISIKAHYYHHTLESYVDDIVTIEYDFYIYYSRHYFAPNNQPQIFQYLIQQQFDVFNWIENGIALDKTKI